MSTRRRVPTERRREYLAAWRRVERAVDARDARAWIFRAAGDASLFIEFLEFRGDGDPRRTAAVADALEALDRVGGEGDATDWVGIDARADDDDRG